MGMQNNTLDTLFTLSRGDEMQREREKESHTEPVNEGVCKDDRNGRELSPLRSNNPISFKP